MSKSSNAVPSAASGIPQSECEDIEAMLFGIMTDDNGEERQNILQASGYRAADDEDCDDNGEDSDEENSEEDDTFFDEERAKEDIFFEEDIGKSEGIGCHFIPNMSSVREECPSCAATMQSIEASNSEEQKNTNTNRALSDKAMNIYVEEFSVSSLH